MKFTTTLCLMGAVFALIHAKDMKESRFTGNKYVAMNRWSAAVHKTAAIRSNFDNDVSTETPAAAQDSDSSTSPDPESEDNSSNDAESPSSAFLSRAMAVKTAHFAKAAANVEDDTTSENPPADSEDVNSSSENPAAAQESQDATSEPPAAMKFALNKLALAAPATIVSKETKNNIK